MRPDLPAEIMFMVAIILVIFSFIIYGLIIKRLLSLIRARGIWILPIVGMLFLIAFATLHIYRILFYFPHLGQAGPSDFFDLIMASLSLARIESILFLGAGIFPVLGGLLYYFASSK